MPGDIGSVCSELNFFLSEEFVCLCFLFLTQEWHCCHSLDGGQALPQWQLQFGRRNGWTHP